MLFIWHVWRLSVTTTLWHCHKRNVQLNMLYDDHFPLSQSQPDLRLMHFDLNSWRL